MQFFSMIVAALSLLSGVFCVLISRRFSDMYHDMGAMELPLMARYIVGTGGFIPGGFWVVMTVVLVVLILFKKVKFAGGMAMFTLVGLIATAVLLPAALMFPLSKKVKIIEESQESSEATDL